MGDVDTVLAVTESEKRPAVGSTDRDRADRRDHAVLRRARVVVGDLVGGAQTAMVVAIAIEAAWFAAWFRWIRRALRRQILALSPTSMRVVELGRTDGQPDRVVIDQSIDGLAIEPLEGGWRRVDGFGPTRWVSEPLYQAALAHAEPQVAVRLEETTPQPSAGLSPPPAITVRPAHATPHRDGLRPSLSHHLATVAIVTMPTAPSLTEPPRPSAAEVEAELAEHVRALAGPDATPRPEQLTAVTSVVADRHRTLLVARTGFGKSAVYFSATRMLRDRGWGPTVVVSPLLALMRDQVAAAERLGIAAVTINSSNVDAWDEIEARIDRDEIDLLLIAPERLANPGFRRRVFDSMRSRAFMLVCDEAHCISDWGHDFRPDYRRLRTLLDELPPWTPVLATTATANQRVTDDVAAQLGSDTVVLRTSLDRESLRLSVVDLADDSHRLAWMAERLDELPGSGIIYCLTVEQAATTAAFLRSRGHDVEAYTGSVEPEDRLRLEESLRDNSIKALVATSALGMGFDKGDLAFCVHLGLPPSPVAYYQQIGRAGRELDRAEVIALPRPTEDAAVWKWFESVSLPSEEVCQGLLDQLHYEQPTSIATLETVVNLGRNRLSTLLNILEVDGAIERVSGGWIRSDQDWTYDHDLARVLREKRRDESEQMRGLGVARRVPPPVSARSRSTDPEAADCGRCDNCADHSWQREPDHELVLAAEGLLRGGEIVIEPRKQWPSGLDEPKGKLPPERRHHPGRALARFGDGGWNPIVEQLIGACDAGQEVALPSDLVQAAAAVLKEWDWDERPTWICPMPSRRRHQLVDGVAEALGSLGKLPVHRALVATESAAAPVDAFQADQANSAHQVSNVWNRVLCLQSGAPRSWAAGGSGAVGRRRGRQPLDDDRRRLPPHRSRLGPGPPLRSPVPLTAPGVRPLAPIRCRSTHTRSRAAVPQKRPLTGIGGRPVVTLTAKAVWALGMPFVCRNRSP